MATEDRATAIVAEAERLIQEIQRQQEAQADFFREHQINPDKVLPTLAPFMGPKEQTELARLLKEDEEAIQREVDEAAARLRFAAPPAPTSVSKKRRAMI